MSLCISCILDGLEDMKKDRPPTIINDVECCSYCKEVI